MEEILASLNSTKEKVKKVIFEKFEFEINTNSFSYPIKLGEDEFFGGLSRLNENEEFNKLYKIYVDLNELISSNNIED